jgi:hypothetical protein
MAAICCAHRTDTQIAALRMLPVLFDRSAAGSLSDASKSAAAPGLAGGGMPTAINELLGKAATWPGLPR